MKKVLLLACLALSLGVQAQTDQKALIESKSYDNWYIGINGGGATKTTHNKWMKNINGNAGLRVGRWFTPAFGLALESNAYFANQPWVSTGTVVNYLNTSLAATINISNWWAGYKGEPRLFEVIFVPALGWGHVFTSKDYLESNINDMTAKFAFDLAFNVDKAKSLQIYLEPALIYSVYGNYGTKFNMNVNRSNFQLNVGLIYKFRNSNGTHNFRYAEPQYITDMDEINRLNLRLAELEAENEALRNRPEVAEEIVVEKTETVPEGVVAFAVASSKIEELQYSQINKVAHYLKNHPEMKVILIGSASTDGNFESNKRLSEERAAAVKSALVGRFGIDPERVEIVGAGETTQYSDDLEYNRVVVFQFVEQ